MCVVNKKPEYPQFEPHGWQSITRGGIKVPESPLYISDPHSADTNFLLNIFQGQMWSHGLQLIGLAFFDTPERVNLTSYTEASNFKHVRKARRWVASWACVWKTYLDQRFRISYTAPCNGVVSHRAPVGSICVSVDHTRRNKHKQNASKILTCSAMFHAQTPIDALDIRTWWNTIILSTGKPWTSPIRLPMLRGKWCQFLYLQSNSKIWKH